MIFNGTSVIMSDMKYETFIREDSGVIKITDNREDTHQSIELYFPSNSDILDFVTELSALSDMLYAYRKEKLQKEKEEVDICNQCRACLDELYAEDEDVVDGFNDLFPDAPDENYEKPDDMIDGQISMFEKEDDNE